MLKHLINSFPVLMPKNCTLLSLLIKKPSPEFLCYLFNFSNYFTFSILCNYINWNLPYSCTEMITQTQLFIGENRWKAFLCGPLKIVLNKCMQYALYIFSCHNFKFLLQVIRISSTFRQAYRDSRALIDINTGS